MLKGNRLLFIIFSILFLFQEEHLVRHTYNSIGKPGQEVCVRLPGIELQSTCNILDRFKNLTIGV